MIIIRSPSASSRQGYAARYDVRGIDHSFNSSGYSFAPRKALSERIEDIVGNAQWQFTTLTERHKLFESRQRYIGFLEAQLVMHSAVLPLYEDPLLQRQFPQHTTTNTVAEIGLDLINLGQKKNDDLVALKCLPQGFINRLGWLYSSELLASMFATWRKIASERSFAENFEISHFAPRVDNSYRWFLLIETIDRLLLSEVEEERIFAGARSALSLFEKQVRHFCNPRRRHGLVSD